MTTEPPPWQWDEETWRGHVELVRAGRRAAPDDAQDWPSGARVAVALSFDSDHETIPLRDGAVSPGRLAQGEYGARVGVPRILGLLERRQIPATFFMPAVSALLRPDEARSYVAGGHEVGVHGWIHERNAQLDPDTELELFSRSRDVLADITGTQPVGIRTPSWDFGPATLAAIRELGFDYDSSLMADDEPYELLDRGEPTGIIEVPVEWSRDDVPHLGPGPGGAPRVTTPPSQVAGIWRSEFDAAHAAGGLFQLTMHPHVIGHRAHFAALEELLDHICGHDDVWFATHAEVARAARRFLVEITDHQTPGDTP